jgi:hypothetical protein
MHGLNFYGKNIRSQYSRFGETAGAAFFNLFQKAMPVSN